MHYRTLGRTGLQVSEIGYGAWGIGQTGWVGANDEESLKALQKAIDLGLNFIDTALAMVMDIVKNWLARLCARMLTIVSMSQPRSPLKMDSGPRVPT
ncbi:hypothetical protein KDW_44840 [Dictyobacter vulcani]|uniref:NADP-dependent oxidoreductase domain-containing protein n=1 Tax=Dictyobacter vulcani TaxID=2607529 RepID=A0A5J4KT34_9CHLR|nr:hypothetical protein KDW_44840 [Dictyobacter vulcani]